jgi:hypothetical protein
MSLNSAANVNRTILDRDDQGRILYLSGLLPKRPLAGKARSIIIRHKRTCRMSVLTSNQSPGLAAGLCIYPKLGGPFKPAASLAKMIEQGRAEQMALMVRHDRRVARI